MSNEAQILFFGNDNLIELRGLKNEVAGTYLNAATVTVTLKDSDGDNVAGASWPMTMSYVASSNGIYRATLPSTLSVVEDGRYTAVVAVNGGAGLVARWDLPCLCRDRV